jgi:protein-L-isoaspartate(D-aspartate) O-methyltransferase
MTGKVQARQERLMLAIADDYRRTIGETGLGKISPPVMGAMMDVPRQEFVPAGEAASAYDNRPLPIGRGQTISQPFIVALMTELVEIGPGDKVLELGTGSGYQTAVLAALGATVYSLEIIAELADAAAERLARLGYANVHLKTAEGRLGWPSEAPFDAILVTAAAAQMPPALIEQLKPGGRLVLPIGEPGGHQDLMRIVKTGDGGTAEKRILSVAFVPLVGE